MQVILKKSFHVVREGEMQLVEDHAGAPVAVRQRKDGVHLELASGPETLTLKEFVAHIAAGDLDVIRSKLS